MKDLPARFAVPLDVPRPRGARLLEAFSLKLDRRVRFFDHCSFQQWVRLEVDPDVLSLCERPSRVGPKSDDTMIDFWVRRHDREEMVLLERAPQARSPTRVGDLSACTVTPVELAAAGMWIANWQRMLPVINATRALLPRGLFKSVVHCVREPVALARVERELSVGDPAIVRGAIFELLRTGKLQAPSLHTSALTLQTLLEPAS